MEFLSVLLSCRAERCVYAKQVYIMLLLIMVNLLVNDVTRSDDDKTFDLAL